jgi:hypothetical protein
VRLSLKASAPASPSPISRGDMRPENSRSCQNEVAEKPASSV